MKIPGLAPDGIFLCCTHTHSAPATIELLGCGVCEKSYWRLVLRAAAKAAGEAFARLRPVRLQLAQAQAPGVSYNRRAVLAGGRVSMSARPGERILRRGPTRDRILLARFCEERGESLATIVSYAAHPCVVCSPNISADFPGELRRRLSEKLGGPFIFLQGAAGNINLPFERMTRPEMLAAVDGLMKSLGEVAWDAPAKVEAVGVARASVALAYQEPPPQAELVAFCEGMKAIAASGAGPDRQMAVLADILNVPPGEKADEAMLRHIAGALGQWSENVLRGYGSAPRPCPLAVQALSLGPLALGFLSAEVFAETALAVEQALTPRGEANGGNSPAGAPVVETVGYAAPLVGYLPTNEAMDEGGYEVEYAYRFYNHPAPFAKGAEPAARAALVSAMRSAIKGRSNL